MGRTRKISSHEQMEQLWAENKSYCDNVDVNQTSFSGTESKFVTEKVKKSITYTLEGFCVYIGMARCRFYDTYDSDENYRDIVTRIREESENDVRRKFETGCIPSQLSGLWMSRYDGYNPKQQIDVNATISEGDKKLLDQVSKRLGDSK